MGTLGMMAWTIYSESVGGKNFEGNPLPVWDTLGDTQKNAWEAVASFMYHLDR